MFNFIDRLLNRVSMYRLISIGLTMLTVTVIVLALFGVVRYDPLALWWTGFVFVASVYLSGLLFGQLFGRRIHDESSYITALILFFIFSPSLETSTLMAYGLVGMLASASKFLLAYRGRHIFNPAAIAAFLIGVLGFGYASWWVATPILAPFTLLGALLILYKTRQLPLAGVFLLCAVPPVLYNLLAYGSSLGQSVTLLASWPFVFFVGYMLSEPLTLPPKRWQQLLEAAIVGVLFAVPFQIGDFSTSPIVALLAGNLIALGFARHRGVDLEYVGHRRLTPTSHELVFRPSRPVRFEAGQYMELTLPHKGKDWRGVRRMFSMTSSPRDEMVRFGVKFYQPSSTFKKALMSLKPGYIVQTTGVNGSFVLPRNPKEPLLLVAGGIGVTPFISQIRYMRDSDRARDIILVYAVASADELAYREVLQAAGVKVVVVTTGADNLAEGWPVISEKFVSSEVLSRAAPDISSRTVYVSGPPLMVRAVKRSARQLGARHVKTDYFTGY